MKKLESSLKNMLLVLTAVTGVSVALLAYVNELTKEPIAQANAKTLNEALKSVVPAFTNNPVAESGSGITVPPGDPEALAQAILTLAQTSEEERYRLGVAGRRYVEENHSFDRLAGRLASTLDAAIAEYRCGSRA